MTGQPDQSPSSRRPDLEVSEVTGSGVSAVTPSPREWLVRIFERGNRVHWRTLLESKSMGQPESGPNWFRCADGAVLSVVAGWGTYCSPRPDWPFEGGADAGYTGPFTSVEVWFPEDDEPRGHVDAEELWAYVNAHGGVTEYLPAGTTPDEGGWTVIATSSLTSDGGLS